MDNTKPGGLMPEKEGQDRIESMQAPATPEGVEQSFVVPEMPAITEEQLAEQQRQEQILRERQGIAETLQEQGIPQSQPVQDASQQAPRMAHQAVAATITPEVLATLQPEEQVATLVTVAHSEGLEHAFALAKKTNSAYIIDRFHDTLVNNIMEFKKQHGGGGQ